ncbi:hypothetical protein MKX01_023982 [Papaver californicum]|nr:hypothetical protein MKX01_023982 [Papaver californicum]
MGTWNSLTLEIGYHVFGWIAFFSWTIGFYPQIVLNYRRKSVVGLNFDFLVLNLTKQSSYLIYNASLFFSPVVQRQYHQKYGFGEMIPVAANDVAFSAHSLLLTSIVLCQVLIYERGSQKVSRPTVAITAAVWVSVVVYVFIAWPHQSWLWLISVFNKIQVTMAIIKYIPQVFLNFKRKSTDGWAIGCILLDLVGGVTNYAQMLTQSVDQGSFVNFYGNLGKSLLSLVTIFYDLIFLFQHYVLYPSKKGNISSDLEVAPKVSAALLMKSSDPSRQENV